jgi:hypothetical protein
MVNLVKHDGGLIGFFEHILVTVFGDLHVSDYFYVHMATIAEEKESIVRHHPLIGYDVTLDNRGVPLTTPVQRKLIVA